MHAAARSIVQERRWAARRVHEAHLHLTLHFLGTVDEATVAAARQAASAVHAHAFDLVIDRVGAFAQARVGWLGCTQVPPALLALHGRLGDALRAQNVSVDGRPYAPHVTVVRGLRTARADGAIPPIPWRVDAFSLMESHPERGYVDLDRWALPD